MIAKESKRSEQNSRHKIHLYSLKKFFNSTAKVEVGDDTSKAWQGRKGYLATYDKLRLEDKQKLYTKVMPKLTIFAEEPIKPQYRLRERLKMRGITDEEIDRVLEGLDLK